MIKFPAALDTIVELPTIVDNSTPIKGSHINDMRDAILAIEAELGVKPSGIYSTVRARFAALELAVNGLIVGAVTFGGDLSSATLTTQNVVGIRGRPVAATAPTTNQVYIWSGTTWAPGTVTGFTAGGDLTGSSTNQTVAKINGATVPVSGALTIGNGLYVSGSSALTYGALNLAGGSNYVSGALPVTNIAPGTDGYTLTTVAGVPTWTRQLVRYFEIPFVSSLQTTNSSAYDRIGARKIDMSLYPATLGSLTRTVTFVADVQKTLAAASVDIQVYDVDHAVQVSVLNYATNTVLVELTSSAITVGSSSGNLRNDVATMYEVSMRMNGGTVGIDAVYCNNARLIITYS